MMGKLGLETQLTSRVVCLFDAASASLTWAASWWAARRTCGGMARAGRAMTYRRYVKLETVQPSPRVSNRVVSMGRFGAGL